MLKVEIEIEIEIGIGQELRCSSVHGFFHAKRLP